KSMICFALIAFAFTASVGPSMIARLFQVVVASLQVSSLKRWTLPPALLAAVFALSAGRWRRACWTANDAAPVTVKRKSTCFSGEPSAQSVGDVPKALVGALES